MVLKKQYGLLIVFLLIIGTPLISNLLGGSSYRVGLYFIIIYLYVYILLTNINIKFYKGTIISFTIIIATILISAFFAYCVEGLAIEKLRFWESLILLILELGLTSFFCKLLNKVTSVSLHKIIRIIYYIMFIDGFTSSFLYLFHLKASKTTILFSEPSHFALSFLPFHLYMYLNAVHQKKNGLIYVLFGIFFATGIQNLTLLIGVLIFYLIFCSWKTIIIPILIGVFVLLTWAKFLDTSYYTSRLNLSANNNNPSVLVFLSGWERAWLNLKEAPLGIGFNQLGFVGTDGTLLAAAEDLNRYDGGSTSPKLICELGYLGVVALIIYLASLIKNIIRVKRKLRQDFLTNQEILTYSIFISFFIELFIRGVGYFSATMFLFETSWVYLMHYQQKHNQISKGI